MDPLDRAQVLLLCDLCQRAALQSHCELCLINLCKDCVGEHLSDSSKRHNVVPYKYRSSAPNNLKCPHHTQTYCNCDIAVGSASIASEEYKPELIAIINTDFKVLLNVTCLSDEEIWTRWVTKNIMLYNLQGKLLTSIETGNYPRDITVKRSGDLVYTVPDLRTVNIVKNEQIQEVIRLHGWTPYYVCSTSSGDLLVTMLSDDKQSKVVRYSDSIEKQTIQFDSEGKPLYSFGDLKYISENRNLDICVADHGAKAVVVVNQAGNLRYRYTGHPSTNKGTFDPVGITTDSQSQILTSDCDTHCIHILDHDGRFLRYIDNCHLIDPWGLCVDTRDNLFVTECNSGQVKKIKYK